MDYADEIMEIQEMTPQEWEFKSNIIIKINYESNRQ